MKVIVSLLIIIIFVLVAGGGYWYSKIYLPEKEREEIRLHKIEREKEEERSREEARREEIRKLESRIGEKVKHSYNKRSYYKGIIQGVSGDTFKVNVTRVKCGGFICPGLLASSCSGNEFLDVGISSKIIYVPTWCF